MTTMRRKLRVTSAIKLSRSVDIVTFCGAEEPGGSGALDPFSRAHSSAHLEIKISDPALLGKFQAGDTFYVDFTPAPK